MLGELLIPFCLMPMPNARLNANVNASNLRWNRWWVSCLIPIPFYLMLGAMPMANAGLNANVNAANLRWNRRWVSCLSFWQHHALLLVLPNHPHPPILFVPRFSYSTFLFVSFFLLFSFWFKGGQLLWKGPFALKAPIMINWKIPSWKIEDIVMLGRVRSGAQCMWTGLLIFIQDISMHMQRNTHSSNQTEVEISRY